MSGPGVVWELKFGSWVLLQPGHINAYAQAVIQTMRADEHERGLWGAAFTPLQFPHARNVEQTRTPQK